MKKNNWFLLLFIFLSIQLNAQCPNFSRPGIHVVQSGENLYRISKKYNLTTFDLAQWNNIPVNITLYACQELIVSSPTYSDNTTTYNQNDFVERGNNNYTYSENTNYGVSSYAKQGGYRHTIQVGETISGLAELYGYTETRFRSINLLQAGEEMSVGSVILSSDCACDRISTYDDLNSQIRNSATMANRGNRTGRNRNTSSTNTIQDRGGNAYGGRDYDDFYDTPQGRVDNDLPPPPAQLITNRNNPTTPMAYHSRTNNRRINGVPTSTNAVYMSSEELSMMDEINLMRSNPVGYIPYIEQYKRDIQSGKSFGSSLAVCDELIAELGVTPPLSILRPTPCIYDAAKKHGLDQKARGSTGHNGSNGSWPWDRVKRECSQMTDGNENLVGGPADVREAVILLLVDDGIPSRGHRKTLLNKDWVYGATYKIGKVGYMPNCWVQKFGY
ncbi:MAG: LysM peptidoglycan-binding domain-containing protein [Saprospiraceae bacterium]